MRVFFANPLRASGTAKKSFLEVSPQSFAPDFWVNQFCRWRMHDARLPFRILNGFNRGANFETILGTFRLTSQERLRALDMHSTFVAIRCGPANGLNICTWQYTDGSILTSCLIRHGSFAQRVCVFHFRAGAFSRACDNAPFASRTAARLSAHARRRSAARNPGAPGARGSAPASGD